MKQGLRLVVSDKNSAVVRQCLHYQHLLLSYFNSLNARQCLRQYDRVKIPRFAAPTLSVGAIDSRIEKNSSHRCRISDVSVAILHFLISDLTAQNSNHTVLNEMISRPAFWPRKDFNILRDPCQSGKTLHCVRLYGLWFSVVAKQTVLQQCPFDSG